MRLSSFEAIATALDAAGVRSLVVGGLAVNAHGYLRFTKDVDLVVQLVPEKVAPGLQVRFVSIPTLIAMKELAGRPRDWDDIQHLRWILEEHGPDEPKG